MKKKLFNFLLVGAMAVISACMFSGFATGSVDLATNPTDTSKVPKVPPQCYNATYIPCYEGGLACTCSFTGLYGSPYSCTSTYCDVPTYSTRTCVLKN